MRAALLIAVAVVSGLVTVLLFRFTTSPNAVRATGKRLQARLLEFRLFAAEPALILRAQFGVVRESAGLMVLLLPPALTSALIAAIIVPGMEPLLGWDPLPVGATAIVTAQLLDPLPAVCELDAPSGIAVESPPVRVVAERQVSWRIRPRHAENGMLRLQVDGERVESPIAAGTRGLILRQRELTPGNNVAWVEVGYPGTAWKGWFLVAWTISAVAWTRFLKTM